MTAQLDTVSYIIPVYNSAPTLALCLAAIESQTYCGEREIIVVDNGSTDRSVDIAKSFSRVTVLYEPLRGAAAARALGLSLATGTLFAFIDADTVLAENWTEACVRELVRPWIDCVQTPIVPGDADSSSFMLQFRQAFIGRKTKETFSYLPQIATRLPTVNSAAFLIRHEKFKSGKCAFDLTLPRCEDTDLTYQLIFSGCNFALTTKSYATVYDNRTLIGYLKRSFWVGYNTARVNGEWSLRGPTHQLVSLRPTQRPFTILEVFQRLNEVSADVGFAAFASHAFWQTTNREKKRARFLATDQRNAVILQINGWQLGPMTRVFKLGEFMILFHAGTGERAILSATETRLFLRWSAQTLSTGAAAVETKKAAALLKKLTLANVLVRSQF